MSAAELVSVIIPVLNGREVIGEQLDALSAQDYQGEIEVVVADNGSTDGTAEYVTGRPPGGVTIRVVDASDRRGAAHARNVGANAAKGELLTFCDADDRVHPDFVRRLAETLAVCDIVTAAVEDRTLNPPDSRKVVRVPDPDHIQPPGVMSPCLAGGAFGAHAEVYRALGGMVEDWTTHEDIEFGWRAFKAGYRVDYLPEAIVGIRYRGTARGAFRQGIERGRTMAQLNAEFPDNGLPPIRLGQLLVTMVELGVFRYRFTSIEWAQLAGLWWGRVRGSIQHRVLRIP